MKGKKLKLIVSYEPMPFWEFRQFVESVLDWSENQKKDNPDRGIKKQPSKKGLSRRSRQ